MYGDHSPEPRLTDRVLVIEEGDSQYTIDEIVDEARDVGAVSEDSDGDEIFYIVFANEPGRVWDFTEKSLRQCLAKKFAPAPVEHSDIGEVPDWMGW